MADFWRGKNVLVAGGAGFVGSYLVDELLAEGACVRVADNLETGRLENVEAVSSKIDFLQLDLRDRSACLRATSDMEVAMNLAAKAYGFEYSMSHNGEMLTDNLLINLNMLEAARRSGVDRYLVVSSSCVYPDDAMVPTPELDVFAGSPESVNEGYGWAKRIAELQAQYFSDEYGMKVAIVRPFNAYGRRYRWAGERSHVIPSLVKKVMDGSNPVVIWGSGNQRRNFLHAKDFARGMMLVTQHHLGADPVNLGFEETVSLKQLVLKIIELSGRTNVKLVFDTSKPEGRVEKSADSSKLRKVTGGFRPSVSLEEGLREMVEWYNASFGSRAGDMR